METKTITWTTPKGSEVNLTLQTTKVVDADGDKVEVPDWSMICTLPTTVLLSPTIAEHPTAGTCIKGDRNTWVPIAAEVLAEVRALVVAYEVERELRILATVKADRKYEAHCNRMRRAMAE